MKFSRCRVCDEKDGSFEEIVARDYFTGSKEPYIYFLCKRCKSLSIGRVPGNLNTLYKNYYSFSDHEEFSWLRIFFYKMLLRGSSLTQTLASCFLKSQFDLSVKSLAPLGLNSQSKILDVGCGAGRLVSLLHKLGFSECYGIDPFLQEIKLPKMRNFLKRKDFFEVSDRFDLVMFHHVFEHFTNLKEVIAHLSNILLPGGRCVIRIPNIDSYSFKRFKSNWFSIHAPFHFALPSEVGLEYLLKNTDLRIEKTKGEQLVEFFLYSIAHELGVSDYEQHGNRRFLESNKLNKIPPLHTKMELKQLKQRFFQVKKYNFCDWIVYYLRKDS